MPSISWIRRYQCALLLAGLAAVAACGNNSGGTPATTAATGAATKPTGDQRPGTVRFTLSYQKSKAAGVLPDGNALVLLIPSSAPLPIGYMGLMDTDPNARQALEQAHGYFLTLDEKGQGAISAQPGTYKCVLVSKNSWAGDQEHDAAVVQLKPLIRDWGSVANKAVSVQTLAVEPAKSLEVTLTFGK